MTFSVYSVSVSPRKRNSIGPDIGLPEFAGCPSVRVLFFLRTVRAKISARPAHSRHVFAVQRKYWRRSICLSFRASRRSRFFPYRPHVDGKPKGEKDQELLGRVCPTNGWRLVKIKAVWFFKWNMGRIPYFKGRFLRPWWKNLGWNLRKKIKIDP